MKYIDIPDDEIEKCVVRKGDVLFNRTNSIELVGKTAVFDLPEDMIIAGYIIRVRLTEKNASGSFISIHEFGSFKRYPSRDGKRCCKSSEYKCSRVAKYKGIYSRNGVTKAVC